MAEWNQAPEPPDIAYARPARVPPGTFSGLYVPVGALNLVFGGFDILTGGTLVVGIIEGLVGGQTRIGKIPMDAIAMAVVTLPAGIITVAGSIGSFWRAPWSKNLVRGGLAVELLVAGVFMLLALFEIGFTWLFLFGLVRTAYLSFAMWAYFNMRVEFYFGDAGNVARLSGMAPVPLMIDPASVSAAFAVAGTFEVTGTDARTGKMVTIVSRAKTETLALLSARALGMTQVTIRALSTPGVAAD